jgi:hypothetical protein
MARSEEGSDAYRVLVANIKERENLENIGLGERVILKMDLQEEGRGMGLVYMSQERDSWRDNFACGSEFFRFSKMRGISLMPEEL